MVELMRASQQWASRPADERFLSLLTMRDAQSRQRGLSRQAVVSSRRIVAQPATLDSMTGLEIVGPSGQSTTPTNWAFGQIAQLAGAPAGYLRGLPAPLAADCVNYGLKCARDIEDVGVLVSRTGEGDSIELRAATGPRYGRIWNSDITGALVNHFGDGLTGDFRVPGEFGKAVEITKANTTLYASDRDMFVFLADENNRVEMPNRRDGRSGSLARGFFVWNSEVGSQSIGAAFFLFDYACSNRIVWGAQGYKEIRLRHTVSAPDRWLSEVTPVLLEYAQSSAAPVEAALASAQARKLDDVSEFLQARKFTRSQAAQIMGAHEREEGRPIETLWDAVTGATAYAKTVSYQDDRVAIERQAGKLLDLVAA